MDGAGQFNYDDRIAAGWRSFFLALPDPSRILDLCTGNGAVAVMAAQAGVAKGAAFRVTGLDLADIDPCRFVSRYGDIARSINFIPRCNCEELQFADASFDVVVSQYGIEYSEMDESIPEAARVLAPGGKLRLFMHAKEGSVVADTKRALADADFLLDRVKLCDKAGQAFRAVHAVESGNEAADTVARADRCFSAFKSALDSTAKQLRKATDEAMLSNATSVLLHAYEHRRAIPVEQLVAKAAELKEEIQAHRSRQRALVRASINANRLAQLVAKLELLGLCRIRSAEARPGAEFVGYVLEAEKGRA